MAIPNARNFATCYMEFCKQQRLRPLPVICVTLPQSLDFTTDRVKMDDWGPILNSLSLDRSLKSISVRSRYQCRKPLEEINSEDKARAMGKAPVVLTRYLLEWLCHSVAQCVRNSSNLNYLELEGIPFPADCLAVLCMGLSSTKTLQYLSLQRCFIGDAGCELICRTIADVQSVRSLNLSHCDLTSRCGRALATALSRQKLSLFHDTWKQSLRYREPNLEAMPGLRRLTLNDNPHLGDAAVGDLIEAIRDSLWLKALDLQRCGLTDRIGKDLLELLDHNRTLAVLDVRQNSSLNEELINEIARRLEENDSGGKLEYRWLGLPQKDQRTSSAGCRRRNEYEENGKIIGRPKSAINAGVNGNSKRPSQSVANKKFTPALPPRAKRTKVKAPLPSSEELNIRRREKRVEENSSKPKVSLHLDLQTRIRSVVDQRRKDFEDSNKEILPSSVESRKIDVGIQNVNETDIVEAVKMKEAFGQLATVKAEYDRLLEESKRNDFLLTEERSRREVTERKLQAVESELAELENALKEKEEETRGYLLVSQQSLNEICSSFDRLLEMLESVTRVSNATRSESSRAAVIRADIKRRVASVIRKTKSENLRRGYIVDVDEIESPKYVDDGRKKFVKSDSDMRMISPTMHLERNIGDSSSIVSPLKPSDGFRRMNFQKLTMSPGERAREIFARILNGDAVLDFCSRLD